MRLLDVAEELFARRGFHAVSIRDITTAAQVDVSQVHYHYGSKEELLAAVVERRAAILNRARRAALASLQKARHPRAPGAEEVLHAFIDPILELSAQADAGWKSYFALIAQVNNSAEWAERLMNQHFNECVQEFITALQAALPGIPAADVYWGYHFLSGALTLTFAETGRIDILSQGLCASTDVQAIYARFPSFFAGGFAQLLKHSQAQAARKRSRKAPARKKRSREAPAPATLRR